MLYFIDFEASQYTQEIISVGCVKENGDWFYSLVRPKHLRTVTGFISDLTGITKEQLRNAPTADEVFEDLYDFIGPGWAVFVSYGNSDEVFAKNTLKRLNSLKAQFAISLIHSTLVDAAPRISEKLLIPTGATPSLYRVADYLKIGEKQNHNALCDAHILKKAYERVKTLNLKECPFPDYIQAAEQREKEKCEKTYPVVLHMDHTTKTFSSAGIAAEWTIKHLLPKGETITKDTLSNVTKRIRRAVEKNVLYCGFSWEKKENLV